MPKVSNSRTQKIKLSFDPKKVVKGLLESLPERSQDVLIKRYGLGAGASTMTLEAIGQKYAITRERVRQIENHALNTLRTSQGYEKAQGAFDELYNLIDERGVVVVEEDLLSAISPDASVQNHVHFLLVLGSAFVKERETDEFRYHWYIDDDLSEKVRTALRSLYESLTDDELVSESEVVSRFLDYLHDISERYRNEEIARRWLSLSKRVAGNPLGEWGRADSPNVNPRGIRDYAYLVIREHGSPLHFTEVAGQIMDRFSKRAHKATTHNELIKDGRFVLVGRGLYALSDWGYAAGVVKDVIKGVLREHGPLTRDEIVDRVLKERYVKPNTVMVNLQNTKHFTRLSDGRYAIA